MSRITNLVRCVALSLALIAAPSFAARIVELRNPPPVSFASLTRIKLGADQVRNAIIAIGAVSGWVLKSEAPGSLVLKRLEKGKYYAEVQLPYSVQGYSIEYLTSSNLNYRLEVPSSAPNVFPTPGVEVDPNAKPIPMIHPSYMNWVEGLGRAIDAYIAGIQTAQ